MSRRSLVRCLFLGVIVFLGPLTSLSTAEEQTISPEMKTAFRMYQGGEKAEALKALRALVEMPETPPFDLFMCGELCFTQMRELGVAIEAFTALLARGDQAVADLGEHRVWMAWDAMGICLGMSGKFPEAEKTLKAGMDFAGGLSGTERWESAFNLACTYSEWGKDEEALGALRAYFEGLRRDYFQIDTGKVLRDSSFKRFRGQESFKQLIATFSKSAGDPDKDEAVQIPVSGRIVKILLPGTTLFQTGELPEYTIRSGTAEGTKFILTLNRNVGDIRSLENLARSTYEKLSAGYAEENRRFIDKRRFYVLVLKTQTEGVPMKQVSIRGYFRHKDLVLDLHVSAMNPTAQEEARMMKMIESVKITKR